MLAAMPPQLSERKIFFREGFKYQLARPYVVQTPVIGAPTEGLDCARLHHNGILEIENGYAWDGASGPALDTPSFLRASLVHDVLYRLIGEAGLHAAWRTQLDGFMGQLCREDGMWRFRAWYAEQAVRRFGARYVTRPKPVRVAPVKGLALGG